MTRATRQNPDGGWHHVMSRGVNKQPVFFDDTDRVLFGRLLGDVSERFGIEVHAYCLMDNHFHLLVRCPDGNLSEAVHHLLSIFARRVNDRTGRVGHLFGARFTSRLVTTHAYLANVVRYIHRNALDVRGVRSVDQYRWSSHNHYLGRRPPLEWLQTSTVLEWFEDVGAFHRFVQHEAIAETAELSIDTPGELVATVDLLLDERCDASRRHRPAQRRAVLLSFEDRLASTSANDLRNFLQIPDGGALRTARHRARRLRDAEPVVDDIAGIVAAMFEQSVQSLLPPAA